MQKSIDEKAIINRLIDTIKSETDKFKNKIRIMEICGTHTMDIGRYGLRKLLPDRILLISGPGCPVCVTPIEEIDRAIEIASQPNTIITTFGDMMYVPGTRSSLASEKTKGADIRILYSPAEALEIAKQNLDKRIVFIGIGFETTVPAIALTIIKAQEKKINNYFVLPAFKTIIPPMEAILSDKNQKIDGFLAPGHVSAIIGSRPYEYIASKYRKPCVITGFEALDILQGILMVVRQHVRDMHNVEIQYKRIVRQKGNELAMSTLKRVFIETDSNWRGLGKIPSSGLTLNSNFEKFNALKYFNADISYSREPKGCKCGDVLKGIIAPDKCRLFGKKCTPLHPVGACMVSSEGSCAAYYKYERMK